MVRLSSRGKVKKEIHSVGVAEGQLSIFTILNLIYFFILEVIITIDNSSQDLESLMKTIPKTSWSDKDF